jgi:hypothetical protein
MGESGPTIDSIEIGEFATYKNSCEWLKKNAQAFLPSRLYFTEVGTHFAKYLFSAVL